MSAGYRVCCCVGYLTNPGGRCCMDMSFETDTGRKIITSPHTVPELPMISGWVCGKCGASNAPWVSQCPCAT